MPFSTMPAETAWALLPFLVFVLLSLAEWYRPLLSGIARPDDWLLNGCGLLVQGVVNPVVSVLLGAWVALWMPQINGVIPGAASAFLLNFVGLDLLYYWQHRWFHGGAWALHRPHHGAARLGAWVTARGALPTHFLFVYLIPSAMLAALCENKLAYFAAAMLTASLDLWRHSAVRWPACFAPARQLLGKLLILPMAHHWHHQEGAPYGNFGANLAIWDRIFGTFVEPDEYPVRYGVAIETPGWQQLLLPWR